MFVLADRSVVRVHGAQAREFLHNLVTSQVAQLVPGDSVYAAILTPQGKILSDFLIYGQENGLDLDVPRDRAIIIVETLKRYKLRAKVDITLAPDLAILSHSNIDPHWFSDPRHKDLPPRSLMPHSQAPKPDQAAREVLTAQEISLCIPAGGHDFLYEEAFPHDANMDLLHGLDFHKGCYIGQEIVSRMQHRSEIRRRVVKVTLNGSIEEGTLIYDQHNRPLARMGRSDSRLAIGLALARLDRLKEADFQGHTEESKVTFLHPQQ